MVPLNDALGRSIGAELAELRGRLQAEWRAESPEAGLVEWAAHASGTVLDVDRESLVPGEISDQRWSEAPVLAAVGYRLRVATRPEAEEQWLEGMARLMSRDALPADRNSFFFRPVELLGIALGAAALRTADAKPATWVRALLTDRGDHLQTGSLWTAVLTTLAAREVDATWSAPARLDPQTTLDAGVLMWLHLVDSDVVGSLSASAHDSVCRDLLLGATHGRVQAQGLAEAGILLIALDRAVRAAIEGLDLRMTGAADFVVTLCKRFPLLVAELGHRHAGRSPLAPSDEYDVQDLLRALLRVHFDDVRPEEWNPSYGGVASRSDLLIKSEKLVIETKMTRKNLGQREVIEELTVDKAQYRTHPDCETLVCFVYDPEKRLTNPSALESDLSEVEERLATKVVVSPRGL